MNYNELIEGYLDGTLSPAEEQELFTALSSSEELRTELKQSIAMDKGLSKRVSAFVPTLPPTHVFPEIRYQNERNPDSYLQNNFP